ncbi:MULTISPECIES: hypothetical protein [unclassified Streptomyces]|nr:MULTISPECIES: hypothetical protein [unclassified Streptomyces]
MNAPADPAPDTGKDALTQLQPKIQKLDQSVSEAATAQKCPGG